MPLDAARATTKAEAIDASFAALGTINGTAMPRCRSDTEPVAWEYYTASQLFALAKARKKRAHAAAVTAGLIFDHEDDPEPAGTNRVVYRGPFVEITVSVAEARSGIDHKAFVLDLLKEGIKPALIKRLTAKHSRETSPAHKFTSSLVTG